jgi:hypothetical protein
MIRVSAEPTVINSDDQEGYYGNLEIGNQKFAISTKVSAADSE